MKRLVPFLFVLLALSAIAQVPAPKPVVSLPGENRLVQKTPAWHLIATLQSNNYQPSTTNCFAN